MKTELITLALTEKQAEGLARLVNRITWPELRKFASEGEADQILQALWLVRRSLEDAGYTAD